MPDIEDLFRYGGFTFILPLLLVLIAYGALLSFPLLYALIRWRGGRGHEPGLGTRAAALFFRSMAILIFLTGASTLVYSLLQDTLSSRAYEELQRVAWGLCVGAGVVFVLQQALVILTGSSLDTPHPADRIFGGFIALLTGLVTCFFIVILFVLIFQKGDMKEPIKFVVAWLLIWFPAYVVQGGLLVRQARSS